VGKQRGDDDFSLPVLRGGGVEGEAFCGGTAVQSEGGGSASD
jgi:hypothetical protein